MRLLPYPAGGQGQIDQQVGKGCVGFALILENIGHIAGQAGNGRRIKRPQKIAFQRGGHIQGGMPMHKRGLRGDEGIGLKA